MGAFRTLRRKTKLDQAQRLARGRGVKPGTMGRNLRDRSASLELGPVDKELGRARTAEELGVEAELHVTKGWRLRRSHA